MYKKITRVFLISLTILFVGVIAAGCAGLSEEEKKVVGEYEVTELRVAEYPAITANSYEYFTIEFKSNRKCIVKSKAGVTVYEQTARWKINKDGKIEVVTTKGAATATELYTLNNNQISGTNSGLVDGITITMTVTFTRVADAE